MVTTTTLVLLRILDSRRAEPARSLVRADASGDDLLPERIQRRELPLAHLALLHSASQRTDSKKKAARWQAV